jgi:hypothetical protein
MTASPGRIQPRILLTVVLVSLVVAVVTIDLKRREAEHKVAELLLQLETRIGQE